MKKKAAKDKLAVIDIGTLKVKLLIADRLSSGEIQTSYTSNNLTCLGVRMSENNNKPLPEYIYIQEILTLSIEQENEINARKPEPESTYVAQFAKEKHSAFMAVISPYLFMELPKIKDLNPKAQNRLLKEILENNICYSVAMLSYLGYLDYLKKTYNLSKEMIYKHISKALKTDTRTIKGNCLVLNPNSKEDRYKYQADQFIEKVELDYNYISSGKPLV